MKHSDHLTHPHPPIHMLTHIHKHTTHTLTHMPTLHTLSKHPHTERRHKVLTDSIPPPPTHTHTHATHIHMQHTYTCTTLHTYSTNTPPHTHTQRRHKVLTDSISYGSLTMEERVTAAIIQLDQKLIWIPVVFIVLRMWGTIRFFISFSPDCHITDQQRHMIVPNTSCTDILYYPGLVYLQSIGDPGQGWGNALLFVVFNKTIAKRLCPCVFTLARKVQKRLKRYHKEEKRPDDSQKKESSGIASERDHLLPFNAKDMDSSPLMYSGSQLPKKCITVQNQTCTSPEASINVAES